MNEWKPGVRDNILSLSPISRIFTFLIVLLPPVAIYASKGMVVISALAGLALLFDSQLRARVFSLSQPFMLWAFLPLLAWALVSVLWTPEPLRSLRVIGAIGILLFIARILATGARLIPKRDIDSIISAMALAGLFFVVLMGVENLSDGFIIYYLKGSRGKGVNDYMAWINPGNAILAVCAWPMVAAIAYRRNVLWGVAVLGIIIAVILSGPMSSSAIAMAVSPLIFFLVWLHARGTLWFLGTVMVVGAIAAPFVIYQISASDELREMVLSGKVSSVHRWHMWEFVTARIFEHPVIGWGMDASRFIPGGASNVFGKYGEVLPLHPHNGFLQIWVELGVVGAVAISVVLACALIAIFKVSHEREYVAVVSSAFVAYMVLGQLSFGIWQNWWLATGIISMTLSLILANTNRAR